MFPPFLLSCRKKKTKQLLLSLLLGGAPVRGRVSVFPFYRCRKAAKCYNKETKVSPLTINMKLCFSSLLLFAVAANGFAPQVRETSHLTSSSSSQLNFGFFPSAGDDDKSSNKKEGDEKDIGLKGLAQLITAGMGAPFLGDYQGVDKETGKMMFTLEANNLVDADGKSKQTSMPYFESGWVDPEDAKKQEEGFKFPWQK